VQITNNALHIRMIGITQVPNRSGKIRRANENTVYTVDRDNFFEGINAGHAFDLQQYADAVVDDCVVVGNTAIAIAAMRTSHATNALWRVTRGRHGLAGIVRRLNKGNQQVVETNI